MPARKKRVPLRILDMPDASWWEPRRTLPKALVPFEFSLAPCDDCPSHCCKANVWLTTLEAVRIALTLAVPLDDVVARVPVQPGRFLRQAMPIPLDEGEVQLKLHQRDGAVCMFLIDVGARGRCGAYALRPGVCRLFPYEVEYGERVIATGTQRHCPTRWLQDAAARRQVRKDLERWEAELDDEEALLAAWRDDPREDRSWASYQRFAVERLAPRFGKDPAALFPAPRRRLGERARREPAS